MIDDLTSEIYENNKFPCAYLLTFRTYGTWLHGNERMSVGRKYNEYGMPKIQPSVPLIEEMSESLKHPPFLLSDGMRKLVGEAFDEVCRYRDYHLIVRNIRTNHTHSVIRALVKPEKIVNDLKAYSTRKLRQVLGISADVKVWARGASTRYLWKSHHVDAAVDYVRYCQEDIPSDFKIR